MTTTQPITLHGLALSAALFAGFVVALFVGSLLLPGKVYDGAPLADGTRLKYKLNGFTLFLVLAAACGLGSWLGWFSLAVLITNFWSLFVVANVFAFAFTFVLYAKGRSAGAATEPGLVGVVKDLFMGLEVNPRFMGVDLKMFAYRPSLMGLGVLNWAFAATQYAAYGHLTVRMWLYQIFYFIYLANYFQFEYGMLYTWDIIAEKFGWMLVWGDYVLVPFFYCICGWFLVHNLDPLSPLLTAALPALFLFGFWMFRGSNDQKHRYKVDAGARIWGKPAETVGGRLLISGFWGIGRKLNYTGELMCYFAWASTTGSHSVVPYLLPLWLACLFPHRAWRDDLRCRAKYGALWEEYCRIARFRMIPWVY